ncbi:MAG: preprotein translocase subunit SecG [Alphaproteobacteria bacterium]|nr:preprotein translocase subunit SecG [Alphaproteobacteria bacterium]
MENIVLLVHLFLAIGLVVVVLLQRSEGGALGIGGGGGGGGGAGGMFSARGAANALTRTTAILAICFMCTSLTLAILAGNRTGGTSILDQAPAAQTAPAPAPVQTDPDEPVVPLSQ